MWRSGLPLFLDLENLGESPVRTRFSCDGPSMRYRQHAPYREGRFSATAGFTASGSANTSSFTSSYVTAVIKLASARFAAPRRANSANLRLLRPKPVHHRLPPPHRPAPASLLKAVQVLSISRVSRPSKLRTCPQKHRRQRLSRGRRASSGDRPISRG